MFNEKQLHLCHFKRERAPAINGHTKTMCDICSMTFPDVIIVNVEHILYIVVVIPLLTVNAG